MTKKIPLLILCVFITLPVIGNARTITVNATGITLLGSSQPLTNAKLYCHKKTGGCIVTGYFKGNKVKITIPPQGQLASLQTASTPTVAPSPAVNDYCATSCGESSGADYDQCVNDGGSCAIGKITTTSIAVNPKLKRITIEVP